MDCALFVNKKRGRQPYPLTPRNKPKNNFINILYLEAL